MIYKEEWKKCKLGDIAKIQGGYPFKSSDFTNTGNIVLKIKNVQKGKINLEDCGFVNNNIAASAKDYLLGNEDILICMTGSSPNAPASVVGRVALFKKKQYGICLINQRIGRFVINEKIANKRFVYYLFSQEKTLQWLVNNSSGSANQANISNKTIENYEFNIPPLDIQQKIAKVLSAIDDKIELNNLINNNLEQQAQAIFKSWFVDFEPFGNTMPLDWNIGKLEDIVEFLNGYAFKSSELLNSQDVDCYDVFKQGHINRGGGFNPSGTKSWYPKDKAKNLEKYILKKGDVLMAMTDMKDNVAILGNTALMGVDNKYIVNQRVGLLRAQNDYNISYPFIYILTNSTDFLMDLRKRANSGVQVNLSSAEIKNSDVVIATKDINSKFDNIVKPFFEQIFNNNLENSRLIQLRDTLLPKLMSGEIDVSKVKI